MLNEKMFPVAVATLRGNILYLIPWYYFSNKTGLASLFKQDTFVFSFLDSQKQNKCKALI